MANAYDVVVIGAGYAGATAAKYIRMWSGYSIQVTLVEPKSRLLAFLDREIADPKGGKLRFDAIGADVMRWLYARQNPATNLNFGPEPANEVRSKVFFKLWNTYAMFCNYAIGDHFDPAAPPVPVGERPDIDRWLLSNLQALVVTANRAYASYDVMTFALAAEAFIEADLSNWYVRRNKDRARDCCERDGCQTEFADALNHLKRLLCVGAPAPEGCESAPCFI